MRWIAILVSTAGVCAPSALVNGISAYFDDTPVPIFSLAASAGQLTVLVPSGLAAGKVVAVKLRSDQNGESQPLLLRLAAAVPGIFSLTTPPPAFRRNALAVAENTARVAMPSSMAVALGIPQICSDPQVTCARPTHPGDTLTIYATGLGRATPDGDPTGEPPATGVVTPVCGTVSDPGTSAGDRRNRR